MRREIRPRLFALTERSETRCSQVGRPKLKVLYGLFAIVVLYLILDPMAPMGELLAYVSAFSLLSIQIALQHRTQVRQQERLLRNQLKLDLYREFVLLIREASTAHAELSAWNTSLRSQVAGSVAVMKEHGTWIPLRYDLVDFWPRRERLSASIVAVIAQLEQ